MEGDQKFYPFDNAVFPNTASDITVNISANVQPSSVTVAHESNTITFTGSSITGTTGNNSFSGLIEVQAGVFVLNSLTSDDGQPSVHVNAGARFAPGGVFTDNTATIGNLSGNGLVKTNFNAGSNRTLQINQTIDGVFSGNIENDDASRILNITKTGPATLTSCRTGFP